MSRSAPISDMFSATLSSKRWCNLRSISADHIEIPQTQVEERREERSTGSTGANRLTFIYSINVRICL